MIQPSGVNLIYASFASSPTNRNTSLKCLLKNRGNIKEIEKELGISYPTVRNKLDEVISALGHKVEKQTVNQKEILEKLSKGQISKDEALKLLKE